MAGIDILLPTIAGVVGGFLSNYALRMWQYRKDRHYQVLDWFNNTLAQAADSGSQYWIEVDIQSSNLNSLREASIIGLQTKLDGISAIFIDKLPPDDRREVLNRLADFRIKLTGGNFQSQNVQPDPTRATSIQVEASELVVFIRSLSV